MIANQQKLQLTVTVNKKVPEEKKSNPYFIKIIAILEFLKIFKNIDMLRFFGAKVVEID